MKERETFPGKTYAVTSAAGCTVTTEDGIILVEAEAGKQGYFVAVGGKVVLSDDAAILTQVFNAAPIASGAGGGGGSASGEKVVGIQAPVFALEHSIWFDNVSGHENIYVLPAEWKNEVITCYLRTDVPVSLSGVTWLYGAPAMMEGFTFVIALQQVDASTILANLAYSLKQ